MKNDRDDVGKEAVLLRRRAEDLLKESAKQEKILPSTQAEFQSLVHELEVHQIELEMQSEELRLAQAQVEAEREKYNDLFEFAPVCYFTIDYDRMNKLFPKQKAALTRAVNSGDAGKVVLTCKKTVGEWNEIGAWPDDWSRWQRALDDVLGWGRSVLLEDL